MKIKLADNWAFIAKKSWSFWANVLGIILGSLVVVFPYFYDMMLFTPTTFAVLFLLINLGAGFVRLLYQPGFKED